MVGLKMTTRTCLCGCGKSFKVYPETSISYFNSLYCTNKVLAGNYSEDIKALANVIIVRRKRVWDKTKFAAMMFHKKSTYYPNIEYN